MEAKVLELERLRDELLEEVRTLKAKLEKAPTPAGGRLWVSSPCTKYDEWSYSSKNTWYSACPCCRRPLEVGVLPDRSSLEVAPWTKDIADGFEMRCVRADMGAIFPSSYCYDVVRDVAEGEIVVAAGLAEVVSGFTMVPVRPHGWIDARFFESAKSTSSDDEATTDVGVSASSVATVTSSSEDETPAPAPSPSPSPRNAYCCALWGANGGYALGAWILGQRLKELAGAEDCIDRVLLHTDDLPPNYLKLLSEVWILHPVDYIDAVEELYSVKGTAFDGVFTKLAAWSLVQYDKVLLLDIDLVLMKNPMELFALEPPAAMVRGSGSRTHGDLVSGTMMFRPEDDEAYPFGQGGGINAGVILLAPSEALFERMLKEVKCKSHPAHIRGNGPEQDYLSRFFAWTPWRHMDVSWNFQVHHVPYAVEHVLSAKQWALEQGNPEMAQSPAWLPQRLTIPVEDISIVHFSGDVKPWHLYLDAKQEWSQRRAVEHVDSRWRQLKDVDAFSQHLLSSCCGGYSTWIGLTGSCRDYHKYNVCRRDDDTFWLANKLDVTDLIIDAKNRVVDVTRRAMESFCTTTDPLLTAEHLEELQHPTVPKPHCHLPGSRVEVMWIPEKIWGDDPVSDAEDDPQEEVEDRDSEAVSAQLGSPKEENDHEQEESADPIERCAESRPHKILRRKEPSQTTAAPDVNTEDDTETVPPPAPAHAASASSTAAASPGVFHEDLCREEKDENEGGSSSSSRTTSVACSCSCSAALKAEAQEYAEKFSGWSGHRAEPVRFHCPATVVSVHSTGRYVIRFDNAGTWGDTERHVAHRRVRRPTHGDSQ